MSVELEEVVGGGDQSPCRAAGGSAAALEAVAAAVELRLGEDRFDHALALGVKLTALASTDLSTQFSDFSRFLEMCVADPGEAAQALAGLGVETTLAADIVRRYGKEGKRLHLDLRHAREARIVSIKHRLESELVDDDVPGWRAIDQAIEALVSTPASLTSALDPAAGLLPVGDHPPQVVINQQFFQSVEGTIIQGIQGTVNVGVEARELLSLVRRFGGDERAELESAVHELEDQDARTPERLQARQRLKGFLFKLGDKVESAALDVLQHYIESKLGV